MSREPEEARAAAGAAAGCTALCRHRCGTCCATWARARRAAAPCGGTAPGKIRRTRGRPSTGPRHRRHVPRRALPGPPATGSRLPRCHLARDGPSCRTLSRPPASDHLVVDARSARGGARRRRLRPGGAWHALGARRRSANRSTCASCTPTRPARASGSRRSLVSTRARQRPPTRLPGASPHPVRPRRCRGPSWVAPWSSGDARVEDQPDNHDTGEPLRAGSWIAPRRNRWVDAVPAGIGEPARWNVDGVTRPAIPTLNGRHVFDVDFPIDVVYTWVDGSDPAWQQRKAAAHEAVGLGELNEFASNESRFLSRDELRYSLRSLDMYAGWVRHVYLVTDHQVPSWLDTEQPADHRRDHRELFGDRGKLPDLQLARDRVAAAPHSRAQRALPLPERRRLLRPPGRARRSSSTATASPTSSPRRRSSASAGTGAFDRPGDERGEEQPGARCQGVRPHHDQQVQARAPHPASGRALPRWRSGSPRTFARDREPPVPQPRRPLDRRPRCTTTTRTCTDGRSRARSRYFYADIAAPDDRSAARAGCCAAGTYDVFCLNDHDSSGVDPLEQHRMLHAFLERYFPLPSSFEK